MSTFCSVSTCQIALKTHDDHPLKPNEYFCPAPPPPSNFQINLIFAHAILIAPNWSLGHQESSSLSLFSVLHFTSTSSLYFKN